MVQPNLSRIIEVLKLTRLDVFLKKVKMMQNETQI